MKLTDARIRDLKPAAAEYFVWDIEVPGFGVRVRPTGAKSYVLKYRVHGGRGGAQRRSSIGKPSAVGVDKARKIARAHLVAVAEGKDPFGERRERRNAATMAELFDRVMEEHSTVENRPRTQEKNRLLIKKHLGPAFGERRVPEVTEGEIRALKAKMVGKPIAFNRSLSLLKMCLRFAVQWKLRTDNPASGIKPYPETPRERMLDGDEVRRLARALDAVEAEGGRPHAILAIRLMLFLGWRISEVRSLRWDNLNLSRGEAWLPDTKTGARTAVLSAQAVDLLSAAPRMGEYVLPGRRPGTPLGYHAIARMLDAVCARAEVAEVTPHTFRASAATAMAEAGATVFALRDAFGWKGLAMPNRYVKRAAQSAREAVAEHGRRTSEIIGSDQSATVYTLKATRG